jgi:hypothetical protein
MSCDVYVEHMHTLFCQSLAFKRYEMVAVRQKKKNTSCVHVHY